MKLKWNTEAVRKAEPREDFNLGAMITVLVLLLGFIGTSFYILVSSFMEVG